MQPQELSRLFSGCLSCTWEDGWLCPSRFTPAQLAAHESCGPEIGLRARCTAGVRMEFVTDADEISFSYSCSDFSRPVIGFDVYENGRFRMHVSASDQAPAGRLVYRVARPGEARITVWLPQLVRARLREFSLGSARPVPQAGPAFLFLGDSLTQGMTVEYPSLTFAALTARRFGARALNQGVGGRKFDTAVLDPGCAFVPDVVFAAYGTNDALQEQGAPAMAAAVPAFFARLREMYPAQKIVAVSPPWIDEEQWGSQSRDDFGRVRALIRQTAAQHGCAFVSGEDLLPHLPAFFADGAHPNAMGAQYYADRLISFLETHVL